MPGKPPQKKRKREEDGQALVASVKKRRVKENGQQKTVDGAKQVDVNEANKKTRATVDGLVHQAEEGGASVGTKKDKDMRKRKRKERKLGGKASKNNDLGNASETVHNTADVAVLSSATNQDKQKLKREKGLGKNESTTVAASGDSQDPTALAVVSHRNSKRVEGVNGTSVKSSRGSGPTWSFSLPTAGRFINHDPIFVQNAEGEDFVISANEREIKVLELETSLVFRTLPAPGDCTVSCFAVDAAQARLVYIVYSNGKVASWDWTEGGDPRETLTVQGHVEAIDLTKSNDEEASNLFYVSRDESDHGVFRNEQRLYTTKEALHSIQVLGNASYIVCQSSSTIILGMKKSEGRSPEDFIWIEMPLAISSTCVAVQLLPALPAPKKTAKSHPELRLAVGSTDGQIHLYDDVHTLFNQRGKSRPSQPRVLHWHREAPSSIKFSRDGNYLISGGKETVLVLWQLGTDKRQYLPHLTSEIQRIAVNRAGDRYALQMGDNSIMVLSTSELKPVANFAGLQMICSYVPHGKRSQPALTAVLQPKNHNHLMLTVPSTQPPSSQKNISRPFLQTFDVRSSRHITRQALTRNNVTDFNLGPEQTPIAPPDVSHIAISHDGMWLATLDEWAPPMSDLEHLGSAKATLKEERKRRREVYLKIWTWDEHQGMWTLTTRIDAPHARTNDQDMGAGNVFALVPDPKSRGFATIGEDNFVRIWKPQRRNKQGRSPNFAEWTCRHTVRLLSGHGRADSPLDFPRTGVVDKPCMAYSVDGSLLAAAQPSLEVTEAPVVHFIDTFTGQIKLSTTALANDNIHAMGFLERYLVVLSSTAAYVWDLVKDRAMYKINLLSEEPTSGKPPQLAVNNEDGTFAIVTHSFRRRPIHAKVEIFSPQEPLCVLKEELKVPVEAVLAGNSTQGYTLLFADATIRTLSHAGGMQMRSHPSTETITVPESSSIPQMLAIDKSDANADETMAEVVAESDGRSLNQAEHHRFEDNGVDEDDRRVVRPEQLAGIFDVGESFAMPAAKDMFHAVVDLVARKPHNTSQANDAT